MFRKFDKFYLIHYNTSLYKRGSFSLWKKTLYDYYIRRIAGCISHYNRRAINEKVFTVNLSDFNKFIRYKIEERHIAHLLGVNTYFLKSHGLVRADSSYNILNELVDNSNRIYNNLMTLSCVEDISKLFSPYIRQKLDIFASNLDVNLSTLLAVVEFDKEKINFDSKELMNIDYLIIRKLSNGTYPILTLTKQPLLCGYAPVSSLLSLNLSDFSKYLNSQNGYMISSVTIRDSRGDSIIKMWLDTEEKLERIKFLQQLQTDYGVSASVSRELEFQLNKYSNTITQVNQNLANLCQCLKSRESKVSFSTDKLNKITKELFENISMYSLSSVNDLDLKSAYEKEYEKRLELENEKKHLLEKIALLEQQNQLKQESLQRISDTIDDGNSLKLINPDLTNSKKSL